MASIEKVTASGVVNWLRHNNRTIENDGNTDIDYSRSKDNYSLTPYIDIPREEQFERREEIRKLEYQHYKELKEQFYCFNRKDVNTMVSVVVTLPKEINDPETEEKFFKGVADFLTDRYGNTVSITVHKDEGKHYVLKDNNGNPLLDDSGKPIKEWHEGRPHLHYTFVPTVKIDKKALSEKKNPIKAMSEYEEKISAKERINRTELLHLHPDLNHYINEKCGIKCNLNSGITKSQGGNKSVEQLKKDFDQKVIRELTIENERLRTEITDVKHELSESKSIYENKIVNYEDQRSKYLSQLKQKDETIHQLQRESTSKDAVIESIKKDLKHDRDRINDLEYNQQNINTGKNTIEKQKHEIDVLQEQVLALKKDLKNVEAENTALLKNKDAELQLLKEKNAELEVKLAQKNIEHSEDINNNKWGQTNNWGQNRSWGNVERGTGTWTMDQNN